MGMTEEDWKSLSSMSVINPKYEGLLNRTEIEEEHPEWYENDCFCRLCMSCA